MVPQSDGLNAVLKGFGPQSIFLKKKLFTKYFTGGFRAHFLYKKFPKRFAWQVKMSCCVLAKRRFLNTWIYYKNVLILYRKAE